MRFLELSATEARSIPDAVGAEIILSIVRSRWSGVARFQTDKIIRVLEWNHGHLLETSTNAKSELSASFLLKAKKMTQAQFDTFLAETRKSKAKAWDLASGIAGLPPDISASLRAQWILQLVHTLLQVPSCTVQLTPKEPSTAENSGIHGFQVLVSYAASLNLDQLPQLCPDMTPDAVIRVDEKLEKILGPLPLPPEEKGLFTVVKNSRNVQEVYEGSFIGKEKISRLLFAFWCSGLVSLESPAMVALRNHVASLKPEETALRNEMVELGSSLQSKSYYDWLGLEPAVNGERIAEAAQRKIERYGSPAADKVLFGDEKKFVDLLIRGIKEAQRILSESSTRQEYDAFLATGKTGAFAGQSVRLKEEDCLGRAAALKKQGKGAEAVQLLSEGLSQAPNSGILIAAYARTILENGAHQDATQKEKALAELKRGLKLTPVPPEVYVALGLWMEALGQKDKATEAFRRVLTLAPFSEEAAEGLERLQPGSGIQLQVAAISQRLPSLTLYDLLQVNRQANLRSIQEAYRNCTRRFHPDRFFQTGNPKLQDLSKQIYKRMVEAYMTLKNPSKRTAYDQGLITQGGAGNLTTPVPTMPS